VFDSRVPVNSLIPVVTDLGQDADRVLTSLDHEYIECFGGLCEGLHFVRSDHLMQELHQVVPIQSTVSRLLQVLDEPNLLPFVTASFARFTQNEDVSTMKEQLVRRYKNAALASIAKAVEALHKASEEVYFRMNKQFYDRFIDRVGIPGAMIMSTSTSPL